MQLGVVGQSAKLFTPLPLSVTPSPFGLGAAPKVNKAPRKRPPLRGDFSMSSLPDTSAFSCCCSCCCCCCLGCVCLFEVVVILRDRGEDVPLVFTFIFIVVFIFPLPCVDCIVVVVANTIAVSQPSSSLALSSRRRPLPFFSPM